MTELSNTHSLLYLIKGKNKEEKIPYYLTFASLLSEKEGKDIEDFYKISCKAIRAEGSSTRAEGRLELMGEIIPQTLPYNTVHNIASLLATGEIRDAKDEKTKAGNRKFYKQQKRGCIRDDTVRAPNSMGSNTGMSISSADYF